MRGSTSHFSWLLALLLDDEGLAQCHLLKREVLEKQICSFDFYKAVLRCAAAESGAYAATKYLPEGVGIPRPRK